MKQGRGEQFGHQLLQQGFENAARLCFGLLVAFLALVVSMSADAARITNVTTAVQGSDVILAVEISGASDAPKLFYLDGPQRIVIDFSDTQIVSAQRLEGSGPVKSIRVAQNSPTASRIVIDLASPAVAAVEANADGAAQPGALRILVRGTTPAGFAEALKSGRRALAVAPSRPDAGGGAAAKPTAAASAVTGSSAAGTPPSPAPIPAATPAPSPSAQKRLPVVVIDAGHGGQDPGAPSVLQGRWEKEVTLAIAKAIKAELDRSGKVRAVLTRSTDMFIPLGRRVEIAREAGANLFISIHADSIARPDIHGATVYTLSETASDKEAEKLAAKENKADIIAGINLGAESPDVTDILIDLVQRETMNLSADFAGYIVREVGKHRYFRSNNHRFAGFRVLKAPDVPSVLLETGYMSNLEDSRFLFSESGQAAIARGVRQAVEAYFQRHTVQASVVGAP